MSTQTQKQLNAVVLSLSGSQLSDLFFNYEHPRRDAIYQRRVNIKVAIAGHDPQELRDAIFADAVDFVEAYDVPISPSVLASDFEARV